MKEPLRNMFVPSSIKKTKFDSYTLKADNRSIRAGAGFLFFNRHTIAFRASKFAFILLSRSSIVCAVETNMASN